ncbi:MAG: hypothetical protein WCI67_03910 [Chloroflexales bacterium]
MSTTKNQTAWRPITGNFSRRGFLKRAGAVVAGSVLLAGGGRLALSRWLPELPGETLMRSTFAGHLGEIFVVIPPAGARTWLRLADVRDLPVVAGTSAQQEHSFSLLFRGPTAQPLNQGTYHVEQTRIGSFTVFITPQAPDRDARYYEAVFNRLIAS